MRLYNLLETDQARSRLALYLNHFLIFLILANVLAVIIESEPSIGRPHSGWFWRFEIFSVTVFLLEYLARLWCCIEKAEYQGMPAWRARLKYAVTPMALVDLIAILPFLLSLFLTLDLRYLRLLRVMRLMKLTHYFQGFNVFLSVIQKELKSITGALVVMLVLIVIAASLMYTLESQRQPEVFGSIPRSLWWAVVTMTTVGYGDVTPLTTAGRVVATFIMLIGVGLVALPAGMLAARFGEELRERKRSLHLHIEQALADGQVDEAEYQLLKDLAEKLDISDEDLEKNIALLKQSNRTGRCPLCGHQT
ncbi:ion transporter [Bowmanella dokdonensis]|uniref:Ion transporter n=1 Tax=Bowmanella dokdonensis TaxID=751969 RepID=A0A939DN17_9ALTE|nr:ion transporter [Bowmanella dokdonensis]